MNERIKDWMINLKINEKGSKTFTAREYYSEASKDQHRALRCLSWCLQIFLSWTSVAAVHSTSLTCSCRGNSLLIIHMACTIKKYTGWPTMAKVCVPKGFKRVPTGPDEKKRLPQSEDQKLSHLLRQRANARNVSYTPYPTGKKTYHINLCWSNTGLCASTHLLVLIRWRHAICVLTAKSQLFAKDLLISTFCTYNFS